MAMIVVVLGTVLLSVFGASLVMTTSSEAMAAGNFRRAEEGLYAADAILERALADIRSTPGWDLLIDGSTQSSFVDGPPAGARTLPDGSIIDLGQWLSLLNCRKPMCSAGDLSSVTAERPWGPNNPVWRLYAYGPMRALLGSGSAESPCYGLVAVADNPARRQGVLWVRAEAFGPRGAHRVVEMTITREDGSRGRVLSWREVR